MYKKGILDGTKYTGGREIDAFEKFIKAALNPESVVSFIFILSHFWFLFAGVVVNQTTSIASRQPFFL